MMPVLYCKHAFRHVFMFIGILCSALTPVEFLSSGGGCLLLKWDSVQNVLRRWHLKFWKDSIVLLSSGNVLSKASPPVLTPFIWNQAWQLSLSTCPVDNNCRYPEQSVVGRNKIIYKTLGTFKQYPLYSLPWIIVPRPIFMGIDRNRKENFGKKTWKKETSRKI